MSRHRAPFGGRSILLLTAFLTLWGSAAAQTPTEGVATTNLSPTLVAPPASVPITNQPPEVPPADTSIESLRQKAETGDAIAQTKLGDIYAKGNGVNQDDAEALKWYSKSADQGNAEAQDHLGWIYRLGIGVTQDNVQAVKWFRKSADQANTEAQFELGVCYADGNGVEKDEVEAAKWIRKSADLGNRIAQHTLGNLYQDGFGLPKDMKQATSWYRKSAEQGYVPAQIELGRRYVNGLGVDIDLTEAVKWYRKAADQGDADAQTCLGYCYASGKGVDKDSVEAVKWYRMAAEQGNAEAQFNLAKCYDHGEGVTKDAEEAVNWYRKSADQGNTIALGNLAVCFYEGRGVDKDLVESAKLYLKAAELGDAAAQTMIGIDYVTGSGVIKNEVEGFAWFYLANANGDSMGRKIISERERYYSPGVITAARQRATELQAQIASHAKSANNDSDTAIFPAAPTPHTPKASGSGAFISTDGLVLTAAHVVQGASRLEVVTAAGTFEATVVKIDATNDVALLKCTGSNFTPLSIAPSKEARAGTTVFTVGFPNIQIQGFDPKLTKGEISSQTGFKDDPTEWQISVPIQPGNSGGPLCDENGNLIGIVESTLNPLTMAKIAEEIPQDVNYAVKSSYILPLLDDVQNLPAPRPSIEGTKFEDVVANVQKSAVLVLVY